MFTTPAADLVALASRTGDRGHFGVWRSRVRGLPEFGGELPAATLAEEIEADGGIRALVTFPGNPVPSTPNGGGPHPPPGPPPTTGAPTPSTPRNTRHPPPTH